MAYKVNKVSPSALSATEFCPRFRPNGEENEAAAEGTLLHEFMENLVQRPRSGWTEWVRKQDVNAEYRELLERAASILLEFVTEDLPCVTDKVIKPRYRKGKILNQQLKPGLYPECEIETAPGRHGYIDLLVVPEPGRAIIVDHKFVRAEGHDYELQLGAYAVNLHRLVPSVTQFECRIIAPRLYGEPEEHFWTADDLKDIEARIASIEERADRSANDPSIPGCPGDQCEYCHWSGTCPYQAKVIVDAAPAVVEIPEVLDAIDSPVAVPTLAELVDPATPELRAKRRSLIKPLETAIKEWKRSDREFFEDHVGEADLLPGFKATWAASPSHLNDAQMPRIRTALMESLGIGIEQIVDMSPVDKGLVLEYMTKIPEAGGLGMTQKDAKKRLEEILNPFMVRSEEKVLRISACGKRKASAPKAIDVF